LRSDEVRNKETRIDEEKMIREAKIEDAQAIAQIYNDYVLHSTITFEVEPFSPAEMAGRIRKVAAANLPWLVLELDGEVAGYSYATPWKERAAYRQSVESSIYLAPQAQGHGWGRQLYGELIARLRQLAVHAVMAGIAQPNPASVAFHEALGLEKVAHFKEVGRKFERWIDVGYWQLIL
jgi:phosphinothricin acetyltransferase